MGMGMALKYRTPLLVPLWHSIGISWKHIDSYMLAFMDRLYIFKFKALRRHDAPSFIEAVHDRVSVRQKGRLAA
jgi:hypothetical protein